MTICDKIQTVGETLEFNLNARGVSCTFGTGTGEKNILQMTNLITSSNLKGSADSIISISASRPYLLSGEKTDLIVKLTNGLGTPLANKSVTVSDGTSSYNGITNNLGIFTLFNVGISATTTFTATYQSVSASCDVIFATILDYGTDLNHSDIWSTNSTTTQIKVTRTATYTEFAENSTVNLSNSVSGLSEDNVIEFDFCQVDGLNTQSFITIADSNSTTIWVGGFNLTSLGGSVGEWYHLRLEFNNGTLTCTNTTNGTVYTKSYSNSPYKFNFWTSNDITVIRFKNFVIY